MGFANSKVLKYIWISEAKKIGRSRPVTTWSVHALKLFKIQAFKTLLVEQKTADRIQSIWHDVQALPLAQ